MVSCTVLNYASSILALNCSLGEFNEVSPEIVHELIRKSPSKSCPLDPIPTRTLKACTEELVPVITSLLNSSLLQGIFPNVFKEGRCLPKIKKTNPDKEEFDNFRQITNFAFVSKIIERTVAHQCDHYLAMNHLYLKLQEAYQQFHSTETALLRVQNDILRAIDDKKVILVLLDLSAAFDTVDHNILLSRLQTQYGFTDTVIKWFESYLQGRSKRVVIGSTESNLQPVISGVSQGSVLGPLLFILYLGPIEDVIKSHGFDCMLYADDSELYVAFNRRSRQSAITNLEICISDIQAFFSEIKLSCNPTKTEIVHLHSRFLNFTSIPGIHIGDHVVPISKEVCNLGTMFDKHLTMSSHINKICRSASLALRNISRVKKYLNQQSTERLVHAFIKSRLDYCNSLLYGIPAKEINKLQRLQNSAARLVTRSKIREHIIPILFKLHWLPVKRRITFKFLLMTFKIYYPQLCPKVSNGVVRIL